MSPDDWRDMTARGAFALVSVVDAKGSAPRGPGAHMLVAADGIKGTIGGGRLEYDAIAMARGMLASPEARLLDIALGPALDQCCGGRVTLLTQSFGPDDAALVDALIARMVRHEKAWLSVSPGSVPVRRTLPEHSDEGADAPVRLHAADGSALVHGRHPVAAIARIDLDLGRRRQPLIIYGAGHVGRATVAILKTLPFAIDWIDDRETDLPDGARHVAEPALAATAAAPGSFHLIFTQSHPLDYAIARAVLLNGNAGYCGLIGSETKRARFLSRLRAEGLDEEQLGRLTCPIGAAGPHGKEPEIIAIAVAAELIGVLREKGLP